MVINIGIVGLGVMGGATGGHLINAGHRVIGYDIDSERCAAFADRGGHIAATPQEVAASSEIVLVWVPSVDALVTTAAGLAAGAHPDLLAVEMGTLPLSAKRLAAERLSVVGAETMDAPVSGTGQQAEDASLIVFASGSQEAYKRAEPVFTVLGTPRYLGSFGNGSVMKYIANLLVTIHTLGAAEAHAMAAASGLDPRLVQDVIAEGVASSRMWGIRGEMMATGRYEPPAGRLDIIKKDAGIIADYAREIGTRTPLLDVALAEFIAASDEGLGRLDAAAIRLWLDKN